jgi:protein-L-isoaspartate(D-aspartate) O-methyltransferase
MDVIEKYQYQILEQARRIFYETPISDNTKAAYLATPRHLFVKRYRVWGSSEWKEVTKDNLPEHLGRLYADGPLILFGDDDGDLLSTISQPSLVLRMMDMLQVRPGHRVLEVGAGSGWNAALIAKLAGPEGHVHSVEIIPEVAHVAANNIEEQAITNVSIIAADGGGGYSRGAPYDRVIFTAGSHDLPRHFYQQTKDEGLLLMVVKNPGGGDNLFLLGKVGDHFESLDSMPCGFVQVRGKYQIDGLEPVSLEELSEWTDLQQQEVARIRFSWGGKDRAGFLLHTLGFFLGITEPSFRVFKSSRTPEQPVAQSYFGLLDSEHGSLVVAKDDGLVTNGNQVAEEHLLEKVRQWVELGMPSAASFTLQVYPIDHPLRAGTDQWNVRRNESQFLWSLATRKACKEKRRLRRLSQVQRNGIRL